MRADWVMENGRVRTMDLQGRVAQSVAVFNGFVVAVGGNDDMRALKGPDTATLDLAGRTVLPGFTDAHEHLSWFAEQPLKLDLSPGRVDSLEALLALVRAEAARLGPGEWIQGVGYDDTKLSEGRRLHRDDLDRAAPHNPVIVVHVSGHWAVVNSHALQAGGIEERSPDPQGGTLGRHPETGRLDGRLIEMAMFNFAFEALAVQPTVVPPLPPHVRANALQSAAAVLNAAGVCGVGDALAAPSYVNTYLSLAREGRLTVRVNLMIPYIFLPHLRAGGLVGRWGDPWVRCAGIKVIVDGAISGRTAALSDGYAHDPDDHGVLLIGDQGELDAIVKDIHDMDYQACIHANGDLAIEMTLAAIERAQRANPRPDPRHRIEHCTMIDDGILARMADLGVMALPFASFVRQHGEKLRPFYGARADRMFAHRSFLRAGVRVAASSDHPVGLYAPLVGIQSMVTRTTPEGEIIGPDERISLEEAVRMYTTYAAYATFEEGIKGSLTPKRVADLVVLARDPWEVPPEEIAQIPVDLTMVGGRMVHGSP